LSPPDSVVRAQAPIGAPDRDLAAAVRAELAAIEPARRCCRLAERAGLGTAATGQARTPMVGRLAIRLDDGRDVGGFDIATAPVHCRISYLRGAVLAHGSLSVSATGSHLELVVPGDELAAHADLVAGLGYPAGARVRRGRGVLTWKNAETIVNLLRLLGASATTLELETRLVGRSVHGHLNRVANAEHANLRRAVAAASRQLADIELLDGRGELSRLPKQVRRVAESRRRAPEATFAELAANLDLSRGQVQRAFQFIESAALHAGEE
jgi:DNA-binding protein WhiA